jgi:hypothetical protein
MHRITIALVYVTLLLVSICPAQQTSATSPSLVAGPVLGGDGTKNYIPLWITQTYMGNSVLYQSGGNIGVGNTSPAAKLDVSGSINSATTYASGGSVVLSIGKLADDNLFLGVGAGLNNVTGSGQYNTFSGYFAGLGNNTGTYNTFYGAFDGASNSTGFANAYYGALAGQHSTTGAYNTLLGWDAGDQSNGTGNTYTGAGAGAFGGGDYNTYYGYSAGTGNRSGSFNTFLGFQAGLYITTGSDDVYIANPGPLSGPEYNTIRIGTQGHGDAEQNVTYIAGIYGSIPSGGVPVYINSDGLLGTQPSSLRFKEQVRDMGDSTDGLMKLRPVTFFYKPEYEKGERTLQYGLIAEEVAKVYPELVAYDNDGQPYSVRYQYLATMLLNEVQQQYRRAEKQSEVIAAQQQEIETLKRQFQVQNATMEERLLRLEWQARGEVAARAK